MKRAKWPKVGKCHENYMIYTLEKIELKEAYHNMYAETITRLFEDSRLNFMPGIRCQFKESKIHR